MLLVLAACAPAARPVPISTPAPVGTPPQSPLATPVPAIDPATVPAVENIRQLLARQLQIDPTTINVISVEKVEFSDSCLGLGQANESCAAVITQGYKITFDVAGETYVVHTDEGSSQMRVAAAPAPAVGETIIAWNGTVDNGSCYESLIGVDGVAFGPCYGQNKIGGKFVTEARQSVLQELAAKYASFEANNEFGSVRFTGTGSTPASAADQQLITRWAQMVTMEAAGGESLAGMEYRGPAEVLDPTMSGGADTSKCASMRLGTPITAMLGVCDGTATDKDMGKATYLEWEQLRDRFAPFVYETAMETITFEGMGLESSEAWQRAILAWARARHAELASGTASAAANTVLSWNLGQDYSQKNVCTHLTVMSYGYAYAEERMCEGGDVMETAGGWLTTAELTSLDEWIYQRAPLSVDSNYVTGQGRQALSEAEQAEVNVWAMNVWARLWNQATVANLAPEALAQCPEATAESKRLVDARRGICLLMPADYTVFEPNPNEIVIAKDSLLNVTEPRLMLSMTGAGPRTLEEFAADMVASMPGFDIKQSTAQVAGTDAIVLDNVPGQDLLRRVLFLHNGKFYDLTFSPADHAQMEEFYQAILAGWQLIE